jgi:hypothetical protein
LEAGVLGKRKRGDGEDGEAEAEDEWSRHVKIQ